MSLAFTSLPSLFFLQLHLGPFSSARTICANLALPSSHFCLPALSLQHLWMSPLASIHLPTSSFASLHLFAGIPPPHHPPPVLTLFSSSKDLVSSVGRNLPVARFSFLAPRRMLSEFYDVNLQVMMREAGFTFSVTSRKPAAAGFVCAASATYGRCLEGRGLCLGCFKTR